MSETSGAALIPPSLALLREQRSHVLFVLSDPLEEKAGEFSVWYQGVCRDAVMERPEILRATHYEEDDVDITGGLFPRLPLRHLAVYELSIDGAERSEETITAITSLYKKSGCAKAPATWLYFPIGEKAGLSVPDSPRITVAYANGVAESENEFREWYTTRHIRHALNIPALASGQCFERTQFQRPGEMEAGFHIIAIYEQTGSSEEIIEAFKALPPETIAFPALDLSRFAETAYRRIA